MVFKCIWCEANFLRINTPIAEPTQCPQSKEEQITALILTEMCTLIICVYACAHRERFCVCLCTGLAYAKRYRTSIVSKTQANLHDFDWMCLCVSVHRTFRLCTTSTRCGFFTCQLSSQGCMNKHLFNGFFSRLKVNIYKKKNKRQAQTQSTCLYARHTSQ